MKKVKYGLILIILFSPSLTFASDLEGIGKAYYEAWTGTQMPNASGDNLTKYLSFLTNDVGHQHLPYDPESAREPDNKERMLKGMSYYLGSHTKYSSRLISLTTGYNVIIIKYSTKSEGIHPQTKEVVKQEYDTVEVLEIENDKVAVIRKYSE